MLILSPFWGSELGVLSLSAAPNSESFQFRGAPNSESFADLDFPNRKDSEFGAAESERTPIRSPRNRKDSEFGAAESERILIRSPKKGLRISMPARTEIKLKRYVPQLIYIYHLLYFVFEFHSDDRVMM